MVRTSEWVAETCLLHLRQIGSVADYFRILHVTIESCQPLLCPEGLHYLPYGLQLKPKACNLVGSDHGHSWFSTEVEKLLSFAPDISSVQSPQPKEICQDWQSELLEGFMEFR